MTMTALVEMIAFISINSSDLGQGLCAVTLQGHKWGTHGYPNAWFLYDNLLSFMLGFAECFSNYNILGWFLGAPQRMDTP